MNTQTQINMLGFLLVLAILGAWALWRTIWPMALKRRQRPDLESKGLRPAVTPLLGLPVWLTQHCCGRPLEVVERTGKNDHYTAHFGHCRACGRLVSFEIVHGY